MLVVQLTKSKLSEKNKKNRSNQSSSAWARRVTPAPTHPWGSHSITGKPWFQEIPRKQEITAKSLPWETAAWNTISVCDSGWENFAAFSFYQANADISLLWFIQHVESRRSWSLSPRLECLKPTNCPGPHVREAVSFWDVVSWLKTCLPGPACWSCVHKDVRRRAWESTQENLCSHTICRIFQTQSWPVYIKEITYSG